MRLDPGSKRRVLGTTTLTAVVLLTLPWVLGARGCGPDEVKLGDDCRAEDCGPAPGIPSSTCEDGSVAGPICAATSNGGCGWSVRECPAPSCDPADSGPAPSCDPADSGPAPSPPQCGGAPGRACPPTHVCEDIPGDDCDPAVDGPDCPGVCVPVGSDPCASVTCPSTHVCEEGACVPLDDPACAGVVCPDTHRCIAGECLPRG